MTTHALARRQWQAEAAALGATGGSGGICGDVSVLGRMQEVRIFMPFAIAEYADDDLSDRTFFTFPTREAPADVRQPASRKAIAVGRQRRWFQRHSGFSRC